MSEIKRIEDQLRRAHEGGAWHGPSLNELLSDVTTEQAAAKPIENTHSIWELVLHIAAWEEAVRRRLTNERADVTDEENFPTITDTSEEAWQNTKEYVSNVNKNLRDAVLETEDESLNEKIMPIEGMSSRYVSFHGAVQHTLYHAGQIAVLKKIVSV
jgi:uncharacterized damage-inducible protein DinB